MILKRNPLVCLGLRAASALRVAACLALGAVPAVGQGQIQLPDFGDSSARALSASDDRALGEVFMREVRASLTLDEDPEVEAYIDELGWRLGTHSDSASAGFDFFVVAEPDLNAFAGPGGHIGVNAGLILATETESELASVLAHEIAHVTQRHLARKFEQAQTMGIPALAGLLAAIIIGTQNPQAGQAAATAVLGSQIQSQLNFSRAHETEADRVGMRLLADAGFDPRAMPLFFERLQDASRYYRKPPEWLSTHPLTTSRIADSRSRAETYPTGDHPSTLAFHLVRAKLRVAAAINPRETIQQFQEAVEASSGDERIGARYGLGLALTAAGRHEDAAATLRELIADAPQQVSFRAALAESVAAAGQFEDALSAYVDALAIVPDDGLLVQGYARLLVQQGQARKAIDTLAEYAKFKDKNATMYRYEAEAHEQLGAIADAHFALAEHYQLSGDLDGAIRQLELAQQRSSNNFYTSSRIDARLEQLEAERASRLEQ